MAKLFTFTGEIKDIYPKNGKSFYLKELQRFVDGYIEVIHSEGDVFIVNGNGILLELPDNYEASYKAKIGLVGNVVNLTQEEWKETHE